MSVNSIASLSTTLASAQTNQDVGTLVQKKATDIATNAVSELLTAIPSPAAVNLPENLGKNINTQA